MIETIERNFAENKEQLEIRRALAGKEYIIDVRNRVVCDYQRTDLVAWEKVSTGDLAACALALADNSDMMLKAQGKAGAETTASAKRGLGSAAS